MKRIWVLLSLMLVMVAGLAATSYVSATPSAGFTEVNGDIFDSWGICRTRASGKDGFYQISETAFRPVIAFESLGKVLLQPIAWVSRLPANIQTNCNGQKRYFTMCGIG